MFKQLIFKTAYALGFALTPMTPGFWAGLSLYIVTGEIIYLLMGLISAPILQFACTALYNLYSTKNIYFAIEYFNQLAELYDLNIHEFDDYFDKKKVDVGDTKFVVISATPKGPTTSIIKTFKTFSIPAHNCSIVFTRSEPEYCGGGELFSILHEAGHGKFSGMQHNLQCFHIHDRLYFMYIPLFLMLSVHWIYTLCIFICMIWHGIIEKRLPYNELSADNFSFSTLKMLKGNDFAIKIAEVLIEHFYKAKEKKGKNSQYYSERIKRLKMLVQGNSEKHNSTKDGYQDQVVQMVKNGPLFFMGCILGVSLLIHSEKFSAKAASPALIVLLIFMFFTLIIVFWTERKLYSAPDPYLALYFKPQLSKIFSKNNVKKSYKHQI